ncbi:MAG: ribosome assembly RNA-binding protein YhbY [Clostridia bacterium]|nr:ribosome assembly RNA-binding protein YhbY [Clostridia bacterium]MBR0026072.1 ribosome assembly RNA-binding protein YhbY [Clostridia bacterium]
MLNSRQRAQLRALANGIDPIFQIGKGGIGENMAEQIDLALEKRELVKINVLETADVTAKEALEILCEEIGAEPVQAIGRKIVLYKESRENKRIELVR